MQYSFLVLSSQQQESCPGALRFLIITSELSERVSRK